MDFLQNLITCDVSGLEVGQSSFGALLSPQGKILYEFFVQRQAKGYLIDCAMSGRDELAKKLQFYKLRADVTVETIDDQHVFAVWNGKIEGSFPDTRHEQMGSRIFANELETNASEVDWHKHRIDVGIPELGPDFASGNVFPHEALMDQYENAGVDFSKGCYVGQEVVSRMQHRGTARSRFVKISAQEELPQMGCEIRSRDRKIGTMGSSAGQSGLALLRLDRANEAMKNSADIICDQTIATLSLPKFVNFGWS